MEQNYNPDKYFTGFGVHLEGHLKIYEYENRADYDEGRHSRILLNRRNAIHKEHATNLVTNALVNHDPSRIAYLIFGNGGTILDSTGTVTFKTPNVTADNANLYNQVFFQLVDDRLGALGGNQMAIRHISNSLFTDMEIRCLLDRTQPFGQLSRNDLTTINLNNEQFVFDEIGLKLRDGTLITHVVFVPILKTASSLLEVVYTIRVAISPVEILSGLFHLHGVQALTQFNANIDAITPPVPGQQVTTGWGNITIPVFFGCGRPTVRHITVTNSGLTVQGGNFAGPELAQTCTAVSGQFYFEMTMNSGAAGDVCGIGIALPAATETNINTSFTNGIGYRTNGDIDVNGAVVASITGNLSAGQTLGVAVDTVGKKMSFTHNGFLNPANNPNSQPSYEFAATDFSALGSTFYLLTVLFPNSTSDQFTINNGLGGFTYVPPMGYGIGWGGGIPGSFSALDAVNSVAVNFGLGNYSAVGNGLTNGVRSAVSYSSGKRYFEFTISQTTWNGGWAAIIDSVQSLTGGLSAHSVGITNLGNANGEVYLNTIGQIAVDMTAQLLWIRGRNSDNWNFNALANPATGVGGLSIAGLTPPYYFGASSNGPNSQVYVFISNPSYFTYTAPAGFTSGW